MDIEKLSIILATKEGKVLRLTTEGPVTVKSNDDGEIHLKDLFGAGIIRVEAEIEGVGLVNVSS